MELNVVVQNNHRSLDRDALDSCDFYKLSPGRRAGSKPGGCCLASALKLKTTLLSTLSGGATCADEGLDKMFGHQLKEAKTHNIEHCKGAAVVAQLLSTHLVTERTWVWILQGAGFIIHLNIFSYYQNGSVIINKTEASFHNMRINLLCCVACFSCHGLVIAIKRINDNAHARIHSHSLSSVQFFYFLILCLMQLWSIILQRTHTQALSLSTVFISTESQRMRCIFAYLCVHCVSLSLFLFLFVLCSVTLMVSVSLTVCLTECVYGCFLFVSGWMSNGMISLSILLCIGSESVLFPSFWVCFCLCISG